MLGGIERIDCAVNNRYSVWRKGDAVAMVNQSSALNSYDDEQCLSGQCRCVNGEVK